GKGDMLYKPSGASASRVQGSFVSDDEVAAFTDYIRERHTAEYDASILEHVDKEASRQKDTADMITGGEDDDGDSVEGRLDGLLQEAIQMAIEDGQTSTSMLQRRLRIGYARAGRLVDEMEKRGVVSAQDGSKPRKTIMTREQYYEMVAESEEG
ncbi:MAG: DNA translocase FtsK, partial [Clostridia bacterium]|nr:DNA translocase FtsK [Clostridia bacterium]